jgi:hypothetical protein
MSASPNASKDPPLEIVVPPATFSTSEFRVLSPLEKVAFNLAVALFALITIVIAVVIVDWLTHRPAYPALVGLRVEDQKLAIENFKSLSDVLWERTSRTFDLIVIKALLPVFATVVGYLLGKRGN